MLSGNFNSLIFLSSLSSRCQTARGAACWRLHLSRYGVAWPARKCALDAWASGVLLSITTIFVAFNHFEPLKKSDKLNYCPPWRPRRFNAERHFLPTHKLGSSLVDCQYKMLHVALLQLTRLPNTEDLLWPELANTPYNSCKSVTLVLILLLDGTPTVASSTLVLPSSSSQPAACPCRCSARCRGQ